MIDLCLTLTLLYISSIVDIFYTYYTIDKTFIHMFLFFRCIQHTSKYDKQNATLHNIYNQFFVNLIYLIQNVSLNNFITIY